MLEEAIAESEEAHLEGEATRAYRMVGSSASVLVDYPRAERWLREGIDYAERMELWNHRHYMAAHLAHVMWATGNWEAAAEVASHALADGRGGITTRITALHVLGYVALGRGNLVDAGATLEEARQLGLQMNELQRLSPALWGLAEVALAAGDPAAAAGLAEEGLAASAGSATPRISSRSSSPGRGPISRVGDPQAARRWLEGVEQPLTARGIPGTLVALDHAPWPACARRWVDRPGPRAALGAAVAGWSERRTRVGRAPGRSSTWPGPTSDRTSAPTPFGSRRPPPRPRSGSARPRSQAAASEILDRRLVAAPPRSRGLRCRPVSSRWPGSSPRAARTPRSPSIWASRGRRSHRTSNTSSPSSASGAGRRSPPGPHRGPCYTPGLTARTERSSASTATERARDGASRAGPAA